MDEYIKKNQALCCFSGWIDQNGDFHEPDEMIEYQRIEQLTAADVVPVVRGRWETVEDWDGDEHYQCSVCGAEFVLIEGDPDDNDYLYCPHCGADMRKDGDGNG